MGDEFTINEASPRKQQKAMRLRQQHNPSNYRSSRGRIHSSETGGSSVTVALNFDEDAPNGDSSDEGEGKSGGRGRPSGGRGRGESKEGGSAASSPRDARPVSVRVLDGEIQLANTFLQNKRKVRGSWFVVRGSCSRWAVEAQSRCHQGGRVGGGQGRGEGNYRFFSSACMCVCACTRLREVEGGMR